MKPQCPEEMAPPADLLLTTSATGIAHRLLARQVVGELRGESRPQAQAGGRPVGHARARGRIDSGR